MRHAVFLGDLGGRILVATDNRGDLDFWNALERVEMLLAECALACYADPHRVSLRCQPMAGLAARRLFAFGRGGMLAAASASVLEYYMTDGGVRGRHGVEAIDFLHVVVERAAHDEPHHHFDAFGTGLAHVFDVGNARELLRIFAEIVQERLVPFAVDQSRPRPADLV